MDDSFITRILVIRLSSIGDIVLTTPVVRRLATQLDGQVEVHFLTKEKFASVLQGNPHIHRIHTMRDTVQEVLPELEKIGFHYIIDLHNNIRSSIVKRRLKALAFTFDKINFRKWLWVNLGWNTLPQMHVVDRYMATIKAFGTDDDGKGLDFFIPDDVRIDLPASHSSDYVAFAVGAAHEGKRMSPEKIIGWLKHCDFPVVLIGGKEDMPDAQAIVNACGANVVSRAGEWSLHQSALAVRDAVAVIAGDTGMMHIASAFQKKILSLWGCTVPGLGMYPYRPHPESAMLEPHGRKKRPCSKLGNHCKYGMQHKCIDQIPDEEIISTLSKWWNERD